MKFSRTALSYLSVVGFLLGASCQREEIRTINDEDLIAQKEKEVSDLSEQLQKEKEQKENALALAKKVSEESEQIKATWKNEDSFCLNLDIKGSTQTFHLYKNSTCKKTDDNDNDNDSYISGSYRAVTIEGSAAGKLRYSIVFQPKDQNEVLKTLIVEANYDNTKKSLLLPSALLDRIQDTDAKFEALSLSEDESSITLSKGE